MREPLHNYDLVENHQNSSISTSFDLVKRVYWTSFEVIGCHVFTHFLWNGELHFPLTQKAPRTRPSLDAPDNSALLFWRPGTKATTSPRCQARQVPGVLNRVDLQIHKGVELLPLASYWGVYHSQRWFVGLWSSFRFQLRSKDSHVDVSQKFLFQSKKLNKAAMCGVFSHSPCSDLAVVSHIQPTNLWTILDRTASLLIIFAASLPPRNKMVRACASIFWSNSLLARSCEGFVSF